MGQLEETLPSWLRVKPSLIKARAAMRQHLKLARVCTARKAIKF
jgi:hypothetical protein